MNYMEQQQDLGPSMLNNLLVALSIILGPQAPNSSITGTYGKLSVIRIDAGNNKLLKLIFENPVYLSNNMIKDSYCKVLVVYVGDYNYQKWSNSILKEFNYTQFDQRVDEESRKNIDNSYDKPFLDVHLEGGIKHIINCSYYSDAMESYIYNERTRSFGFGYTPVQTEPFFWWNMEQ